MKKALLLAPMSSVHQKFNRINIKVLQELGYEVHLVSNFEQGFSSSEQNVAFMEEIGFQGTRIHSIPYQRHSIVKNINLIGNTKELLYQERFDLIHAHTETGGLILRLCKGACRGAKMLYTPHGMSFYRGSSIKSKLLYRPIEYWICNGMDSCIAINQGEYNTLVHWNKHKAKYTHGVGLEIERIQTVSKTRNVVRTELGVPDDAVLVLSIGELDDNKNHKMVIDSLGRLNFQDVYYVICGVGSKRDELLRRANDLGISNRLILAGYRCDIPDVIAGSDIFVLPSYHEGLPVALMEAMAGGLAVLCSDIRGCNDLIQDGENGYLFDISNVNRMDKMLRWLIEEHEDRQRVGRAAMISVIAYEQECVEAELRKIYSE